jgi:hypothetical protein
MCDRNGISEFIKTFGFDPRTIEDISDDEFLEAFKGRHLLGLTDYDGINKKISSIKNKKVKDKDDYVNLSKYYSEIKKTKEGKRKQKTCWNFVKYGKCNHCSGNNNYYGLIINNKWHPADEERIYLKNKIKNN